MIFAALVLAAAAIPQIDLDVLAQSQSGKVLCSNPNIEAKTCTAIAAYTTSGDGPVIETTEILLAPNQPITLTMTVEAQVHGPSICAVMSLENLRSAKVRLNGEVLPEERNTAVLQRLETTMGPLAGKRACEVIRIEDDQLVKYGQVDGVDIKLPGKPVKWIDVHDGYRVAASQAAEEVD